MCSRVGRKGDDLDGYLSALKEELQHILDQQRNALNKDVFQNVKIPANIPKALNKQWWKTVQSLVEGHLRSFVWSQWTPMRPAHGVELCDPLHKKGTSPSRIFKAWQRQVCQHLAQLDTKFVNAKGHLCVEKFGANTLLEFVKQGPGLNVWMTNGQPYMFPNLVHKILNRYDEVEIEYVYKACFAPDSLTNEHRVLGFGSQAHFCDGCENVRTVGRTDIIDPRHWYCRQCFNDFYGGWSWDEHGFEHTKEMVQRHFEVDERRCTACALGHHLGQLDPFDPGDAVAADWYCLECFIQTFGWFPWSAEGLEKMRRKGPPKSKKEKAMQKRHKPDRKELRKATRTNPLYHCQASVHATILQNRLTDMLPSFKIASSPASSYDVEEPTLVDGVRFPCASILSAAGSEAKCYIHGTGLRSANGSLVKVEHISEQDILLAADGTRVEVLSICRHTSVDRQMVWLQTASFKIALTMNHRVMVLRGAAQRQTIPACHLRVGDPVLAEGGPQTITRVQHFLSDDDVFEIMFKPDAEMVTFFVDDGDNLLTKGKHNPIRNRRGGM